VKTLAKGFLVLAAVLFALPASSNAQTVVVNGIGSSALFLELGEATSSSTSGLSAAPTCIWSTKTAVTATDNSTYGGGKTETGNAWVAWTPATAGNNSTCGTISSTTKIYAYLQTDSVVGDRSLFNGSTIANTGGSTANLIYSTSGTTIGTEWATLPTSVAGAFTTSVPVNVAGTDIRPEDAEFATARALTTVGSNVGSWGPLSVSTNQYLGLGYNNGDSVESDYSGSVFHVINFTLPTTFYTQPVGADPVVVAVSSTDASGIGFNSSNITNLNKSTLALYLDGTLGETRDALTPGSTETTSNPTTVILREPLSGTYNTVEYNVPNTLALGTSQDVGEDQLASQKNNPATLPAGSTWNPLHIQNATWGNLRRRAIGTGQEINALFGTGGLTAPENGLGYAFWGVSNFAPAASSTSTIKYLTIDGVDPLFANYTAGVIPTTTTELASVNFPHIKDGTYPIWSLIRLVYTNSSLSTTVLSLSEAAGKYTTSSHPDFVPYYVQSGLSYVVNLNVERSHFIPSAGTIQPATPINGECAFQPIALTQEAGGDVGGVVIPCAVDADYYTATGTTPSTYVNHRN
jgi:hypothetical protein